MKQPVEITKRDITFNVKSGMNLGSALKKLGILPQSVIATREGIMILEDEILQEGDTIILIDVISGG